MKCLQIVASEWMKIRNIIGKLPAETGALLLGYRNDFIVRHVEFDPCGIRNGSAYSPDTKFCNDIIQQYENSHNYSFLGMVHSHPHGVSQLSGEYGDLGYIRKIFGAMPDLEKILVPIVHSDADDKFKVFPYVAHRHAPEKYKQVELEILDTAKQQKGLKDMSRLKGAVDLPMLGKKHVTFVGTGGANEIAVDLVRSGIEHFTLIDFDQVSHSNLTTQGFTKSQVGRDKVQAVKDNILAVNPSVRVDTIPKDFTKISKRALEKLARKTDFWMFMCDQFAPHKLGNELLMKYPKPAIFAGMYEKSQACEIIFFIPKGKGCTPATYKCIVPNRYEHFDNGGTKAKTLIGTTIFHTKYLNSVIGLLAMAMFHKDYDDSLIFGNWFEEVCEHNLIQFRLHPSYSSNKKNLFTQAYPPIQGENNGAKVFEALWRHVDPSDTAPLKRASSSSSKRRAK